MHVNGVLPGQDAGRSGCRAVTEIGDGVPRRVTEGDLCQVVLSRIGTSGVADGLRAARGGVKSAVEPPNGLRTCWERTFGDTLMTFYDTFDLLS